MVNRAALIVLFFATSAFSAAAQNASGATPLVSPPPTPVVLGDSIGAVLATMPLPTGRRAEPFTLTETTSVERVLADGTKITNRSSQRRYHDREGRERLEMSFEVEGVPRLEIISIFDWPGRKMIHLTPKTKQARVTLLPERKPPTAEQQALLEARRAQAATRRAATTVQATAAQTTPTQATTAQATSTRRVRSRYETESLGMRLIAGVNAEGKRSTRVIPVGQQGNDRELRVVTDVWMSPDLPFALERVVDDPIHGKSTTIVTELQRGEPDATLFQVPGDYKLVEHTLGN